MMVCKLANLDSKKIREIKLLIKTGGVGVVPTDTIYGIVGSALNKNAVEKIYDFRKRDKDKPMIILISSINDFKYFDIKISKKTRAYLQKIWPNPVSVVLDCPNDEFSYLHRGQKTLAFRIPKHELFLEILKISGPLVAPSANFSGEKPAETIEEAKKYFGDNVNFYLDGGRLASKPSTIIKISNNRIEVLRQGAYNI